MERADPKLVVRAHPALCMWPLLRRPSCQAATGGEETSCPVVFTVVRRVLVFVVVVVGVLFCFVSFFFGLACLFLRGVKKKVCNYFLQSSHYMTVNNKEEIL